MCLTDPTVPGRLVILSSPVPDPSWSGDPWPGGSGDLLKFLHYRVLNSLP